MNMYNLKKSFFQKIDPKAFTSSIFRDIEDNERRIANDPGIQRWRDECTKKERRAWLPFKIAYTISTLVVFAFLGPWITALSGSIIFTACGLALIMYPVLSL